MIKTGIVNKNPNITKIEDEEELEKFAQKSDKELNRANNETINKLSSDEETEG